MQVGESLRVFQRAFENEPGDWVDVRGGHFAAQAHGFQGDGTAASKGIKNFWRTPSIGLADFFAEPIQVCTAFASPVQEATFGLFAGLFLNPAIGKFLLFDACDETSAETLQYLLALLGVAWIGQ